MFFASRDVMLTSLCVTGTSLIVSTGAVYRYPAPVVKKFGSLMTDFWSFTVAATKICKAIAFTCLFRYLEFHMFEQDSALAHGAFKMVSFFGSQDAW